MGQLKESKESSHLAMEIPTLSDLGDFLPLEECADSEDEWESRSDADAEEPMLSEHNVQTHAASPQSCCNHVESRQGPLEEGTDSEEDWEPLAAAEPVRVLLKSECWTRPTRRFIQNLHIHAITTGADCL